MDTAERMDAPEESEAGRVDDGRGGGPPSGHDVRHHDYSSPADAERDGWREGSHDGYPLHAPHDHGGGLGWSHAAWGEAGGFDHVLAGGEGGGSAIFPVDSPAAGHNGAPLQSHVAESSAVQLDTGVGGTIDIGGNVEALSSQSTSLAGASTHEVGALAHDAQTDATSIVFDVAKGGTLDIGGNVEALSNQSTSLFGAAHEAQTDVTTIIFDVAKGGTLDIGGNVEALSNQSTSLFGASPHDLGSLFGDAQVDTTNIIFDVARGGAIDVGGNVEALSNQSTSLSAGALHGNGSLPLGAQVETTDIIFDVAKGGTLDIGGNVIASSTQQTHFEPHAGADLSHIA